MSARRPTRAARRRAVTALAGAVVVLLLALLWVSVHLRLNSWDGYDYLANARVLAAGGRVDGLQYGAMRPPLLPVLLAPAMRWYSPFGEGAQRLTFMLMWTIGAIAVGLTVALLRRSVSPVLAWGGAALLALNSVFLDQVPFTVADVLSMLTCTLALLALLRPEPAWVAFVFASAAATVTKYPCGTVVPLSFLALSLHGLRRSGLTGLLARMVGAGAAIALLVTLFHVGVLLLLGHDVPSAVTHAFDGVREASQRGGQPSTTDPRSEYLQGAWLIVTPPVLALCLAGLVRAAQKRRLGDIVHGVWLLGFATIMSLAVAHKELRYMFPVLPSLSYLAVRGFSVVRHLAARAMPTRLLGPLLGLVVAAWPASLALDELGRWQSPFFFDDFLAKAARHIDQHAPGDTPIYVVPNGTFGFAYSLATPDPVVAPLDEFLHMSLVNAVGLSWYLGRLPHELHFHPLPTGVSLLTNREIDVLPWPRGVGKPVSDNHRWSQVFTRDVVLITTTQPVLFTLTAAQAPAVPEPLVVHHVVRRTFARSPVELVFHDVADPSQPVVALDPQPGGGWRCPQAVALGFDAFGRQTPSSISAPLSALAELPSVVEWVRDDRAEFAPGR